MLKPRDEDIYMRMTSRSQVENPAERNKKNGHKRSEEEGEDFCLGPFGEREREDGRRRRAF